MVKFIIVQDEKTIKLANLYKRRRKMKRGKVTALVMAFIMAVSVLASPVTMLNTNAAVKAKKITMAKWCASRQVDN